MLDALKALRNTVARSDGFAGHMNADALPDGWVHVAYFPFPHSDRKDEIADYTGPVVLENDDFVVISVWGSEMTFSKDRVVITRQTQHD